MPSQVTSIPVESQKRSAKAESSAPSASLDDGTTTAPVLISGMPTAQPYSGSSKLVCGSIMAAAIIVGGALLVAGQQGWALWTTIILVGLTVLYACFDVLSKIRNQIHELGEETRQFTRDATVDMFAAGAIQSRFSGIGMPVSTWSMTPCNVQAILDFMDRNEPELVVELGSGISTLVAAAWFRQRGRGRVVSFDHDPGWTELCRFYLDQHDLGDWGEVRLAPLSDNAAPDEHLPWYRLDQQVEDLRDIDLLVVDGPPAGSRQLQLSRSPALPRFHDRLAANAAVFVDDGEREGESAIVRQWQEQYAGFTARYCTTTTGFWLLTRGEVATL